MVPELVCFFEAISAVANYVACNVIGKNKAIDSDGRVRKELD